MDITSRISGLSAGFVVCFLYFFLLSRFTARQRAPANLTVLRELGSFPAKPFWTVWILLVVLALGGVFGFLARPMLVYTHEEKICEGPYIVVVRDASDSMKRESEGDISLVEDLPKFPSSERPNAFFVANQKIKDMVLKYECFQIALVDFQEAAGVISGFIPMPEKRDEFLEYLFQKPVFLPGSNIIKGLYLASNLLSLPEIKADTLKVVLLVSDGAEGSMTNADESNFLMTKPALLKKLQDRKIKVISWGIGTTAFTSLIGYNPDTGRFEPIKNHLGSFVKARRYDKILLEFARAAAGEYFVLENYNRLDKLGTSSQKDTANSFDFYFSRLIKPHQIYKGVKVVNDSRTEVGWYVFLAGVLAFLIAALILGRRLRRYPA